MSRLVNTSYVQLLHCMMAMHKMHDNREEVELKTITCTDKLRSGTIKARKKGGKHSESTLHQFADQHYNDGGGVSYGSSIALSTESSALYREWYTPDAPTFL